MSARSDHDLAVRLRDHPRAIESIRRTRARVAAAAFAVAFAGSFAAGAAMWDSLARALLAGVVGWYAGWAAAVTVWRHLLVAEVRAEIARYRRPSARTEVPPS